MENRLRWKFRAIKILDSKTEGGFFFQVFSRQAAQSFSNRSLLHGLASLDIQRKQIFRTQTEEKKKFQTHSAFRSFLIHPSIIRHLARDLLHTSNNLVRHGWLDSFSRYFLILANATYVMFVMTWKTLSMLPSGDAGASGVLASSTRCRCSRSSSTTL